MTADRGISGPKSCRLPGYDLARGLAVLVMVVLNFRGVLVGSQAFPQWAELGFDFLDRRAAAALVMISGAGITLYARGAWTRAQGQELVRRGIFLVLAGSLLALIWSGDILHVYGFLICLGSVLVRLSSSKLVCTGLFFFAGGALRWVTLFDLIEDGGHHWVWDGTVDLLFTGYFPLFPWASVFIAGMLLGRLNLARLARPLFIAGLMAFVASESVSLLVDQDWAGQDLSLPTLPALVSGMGTGLCLILAAFRTAAASGGRWRRHVAAVGRTSLTFYVLHILAICALVPWAGRDGLTSIWPAVAWALAFYLLYSAAALWWLGRLGRGPLEQVMRRFPFIRLPLQRPTLPAPVRP